MAKELENEAAFVQLNDACNFLEHYHLEHTEDMVTRFRGKTGRSDIYVVSDPAWKEKIAELMRLIFPTLNRAGVRRHYRRGSS